MAVYIGLDIGGTKFMAASAQLEGVPPNANTATAARFSTHDASKGSNWSILQRCRAAAPPELRAGLDLLVEMTFEASGGETITAIGAAVGGPLDWVTGIVSPLHQPAWREVPLKAHLQSVFNCPCYLDVDTNVAALGEYAASSHPPSRLLYLTLSTGMGGGLLLDGQVYRGAGGAHPEVGHQAIAYRCSHPERVACECGAPDCLEALVSGNAIRRIYGKPAEKLDPGEWDEVAYNLGQGLRNLATIYLPDEIVIGGGVATGGGEAILHQAELVMRDHVRLVPAPVVRLSRLGYDTALIGALILAQRGN